MKNIAHIQFKKENNRSNYYGKVTLELKRLREDTVSKDRETTVAHDPVVTTLTVSAQHFHSSL